MSSHFIRKKKPTSTSKRNVISIQQLLSQNTILSLQRLFKIIAMICKRVPQPINFIHESERETGLHTVSAAIACAFFFFRVKDAVDTLLLCHHIKAGLRFWSVIGRNKIAVGGKIDELELQLGQGNNNRKVTKCLVGVVIKANVASVL